MKDDIESKLSSLHFYPLPTVWREELLARLESSTPQPRQAPPLWLTFGWGLAWAAVIVLHFSAPTRSPRESPTSTISAESLRQRTELLQSLLAQN